MNYLPRFVKVMPVDYRAALKQIRQNKRRPQPHNCFFREGIEDGQTNRVYGTTAH